MSQTINTNLASLNAQRNVSASQDALSVSLRRLSSGLRINSAKDDAAGLAISDRMTTQINGLNQAARNVNDGISLAQTMDGGLATVGNLLQRMRELAVQAANGTHSVSDRASLQSELAQLQQELNRMANATEFNGIKLLDGSAGTLALQVGIGAGDTLAMDLGASLRGDAFGAIASAKSSDLTIKLAAPGGLTLAAGDLTIQVGGDAAASVTGTFTTIEALAAAVNAAMRGRGSAGVASGAAAAPTSGAPFESNASARLSNGSAFAALKTDGSVVTWGNSAAGGDSSAVAAQLAGGVASILSNPNTFAALKTDGSVVTWGDSTRGGDSSAVAAQLAGGVASISSNPYAFAALKADGSVVTWGNSTAGGNSSAEAAQ